MGLWYHAFRTFSITMYTSYVAVFLWVNFSTLHALDIPESTGEHVDCLRSKVDHNVTLSAGHQAGSFLKANKSIATVEKCIKQCCQMSGCDVAFFSNGGCYSVLCKNIQSCAPTMNLDKRMNIAISFVARSHGILKEASVNDRREGEPSITENLVSEVTKESPFLLDDPSENQDDEDQSDMQLMRSRRESWKETKDMILAIGCGFIAVAVGVVGVIMMTRQLVEDDDIFVHYESQRKAAVQAASNEMADQVKATGSSEMIDQR